MKYNRIICLHILETSSVGHNQSLLHSDQVGKKKRQNEKPVVKCVLLTFAEKKENTVRLERERRREQA